MATKITMALVAALLVGASMTPNHETLARGGGGFGGGGFHGGGFGGGGSMGVVLGAKDSTEVVSTVVDSGSRGDSDAAYGRRFGFYGGYPYFYGGYGYGCSPY
jgi:hypothetical protein